MSRILVPVICLVAIVLPASLDAAEEPAGQVISGKVTDEAGAPVEGAAVHVCGPGRARAVTSDAAGRFRTTYSRDPSRRSMTGRSYIVLRHHGRNLAAALELQGGDKPLTIKLAPAVRITGRVTGPGGKPVQGSYINLLFCGWNEQWGAGIGSALRTDEEGFYEVVAVPPSFSYQVHAGAPGYGVAHTRFIPEASLDAAFEVDEIVLEIADKFVSGTVVDKDGNSVTGAVVLAGVTNQPQVRTKTDKDGAFRVEGLVEGVVRLSASDPARDIYGTASAKTGDENVKVVISKRQPARAVAPGAPGEPRRLNGKPLPAFDKVAPDFAAKAKDKPVLVCLFDMSQRGGRRVVRQLEGKAETLSQKGVSIIALDLSGSDAASVKAWATRQGASFPVAAVRDAEKARRNFGVKSLPWLVLTDKDHIVRAEGFNVGQLEEKIASVTAK